MQLTQVNIEDVFPDKNNPRKKFEGIDELAESFELNSERPGEPFTPPILVQDGGIYRIIDGERRYRAMKKRGIQYFTAQVCADMDEANTVMAMLATDDKQPLSPLEKSQGVQTMLLLGVAPEKVEKAAKVKGVARAKRAMEIVEDAAEDMTIERLIAIEEFSDDAEAVEELTNCKEADWKNVYQRLVNARKTRENMMKVEAVLRELSVPFVEEVPEGYSYFTYVNSPDDADLEDVESESFIVKKRDNGFFLYQKVDVVSEESPEEVAARQAKDLRRARFSATVEARKAFFCAKWPDNLPNFTTVAMNSIEKEDDKLIYKLQAFLDNNELDFTSPSLECLNLFVSTYNRYMMNYDGPFNEEGVETFITTSDFLKRDGYVPPQEELDLIAEAQAWLSEEETDATQS